MEWIGIKRWIRKSDIIVIGRCCTLRERRCIEGRGGFGGVARLLGNLGNFGTNPKVKRKVFQMNLICYM